MVSFYLSNKKMQKTDVGNIFIKSNSKDSALNYGIELVSKYVISEKGKLYGYCSNALEIQDYIFILLEQILLHVTSYLLLILL